jgi:hypothetical protein
MTNYRALYEAYHGPLSLDERGRPYDIHHKDGNHQNNDIDNLEALTLEEHIAAHEARGEWVACLLIAKRMNMTFEERSRISKLAQAERVANGTHNFLDREHARKKAQNRIEAGTHNFQEPGIKSKWAKARIAKGTSPICDPEHQSKASKARWQKESLKTCPHCGKEGKGPSMNRWHFDKCSAKHL